MRARVDARQIRASSRRPPRAHRCGVEHIYSLPSNQSAEARPAAYACVRMRRHALPYLGPAPALRICICICMRGLHLGVFSSPAHTASAPVSPCLPLDSAACLLSTLHVRLALVRLARAPLGPARPRRRSSVCRLRRCCSGSCVAGSVPSFNVGGLAHMVERVLRKHEAKGSIPLSSILFAAAARRKTPEARSRGPKDTQAQHTAAPAHTTDAMADEAQGTRGRRDEPCACTDGIDRRMHMRSCSRQHSRRRHACRWHRNACGAHMHSLRRFVRPCTRASALRVRLGCVLTSRFTSCAR